MNEIVSRTLIYEFTIKAETFICLNYAKKSGQEEKIVLFGSSIAGALRSYLKNKIDEKMVLDFFGGEEGDKLKQSKVFISDGKINNFMEFKKEGTKIDEYWGSAQDHYKYEKDCLRPGAEITFRTEIESMGQEEETGFNKIIELWKKGFANREIVLGGQQTNGLGEFSLKELKKLEFECETEKDLYEYLFYPENLEEKMISVQWEAKKSTGIKEDELVITMEGNFPYGVYQNFVQEEKKEITGLQKTGSDKESAYYIPGSGLKGLVRAEIELLLKRISSKELAETRIEELFGNEDRRGKLGFQDVMIQNSGKVRTQRAKSSNGDKEKAGLEEVEPEEAVYIKIDRLTGGAIEGAFKRQYEIYGNAVLKVITEKKSPEYLFPLIYTFLKIGRGQLPLGGRTSIGLGEFCADKIVIKGGESDLEIPVTEEEIREAEEKLAKYYQIFEGWCENVS